MKQNNRQTSPLGRSTEEKQAGLSLPQPSLFTVDGNAYKYYNESAKNISNFIARLTAKKFLSPEVEFHHKPHCITFQVWHGHFTIPVPSVPYIFYSVRLIHF